MNKIIFIAGCVVLALTMGFFYFDYSRKIDPRTQKEQNKISEKFANTFTIKITEGNTKSDLYAPTDLKAESTSNSVSLSWNFAQRKLVAFSPEMKPYILHSGYRIYRDGFWYTDILGELSTFTDTNLYPGESYSYSVAALTFDNKIEGLRSEPIKIETKFEEIKPTIGKKDSYQVYLASGDSITQGSRAAKDNGWVDQFSNYLKKTNPKLKTINKGVTGTTTQDLVPRIKSEIDEANPDLVSIAVGINDLISGADKSSEGFKMLYVKDNLEKIINTSAPSAERTVFLVNIYYQNCCNKDWTENGGKDIAWNKMIKDLAYSKKMQLIDVYTPMKAAGAEKVLSEDLLHPSQAGHDIIANTIIDAFGPTNEKTSSK